MVAAAQVAAAAAGGGGSAGGGGAGQSVTVSGTVTSASGNSTALAGATITVVGSSTTTTTAADGTFSLSASAGANLFLNVSLSTYETCEFGLVVSASGNTGVALQLLPTATVQGAIGSLTPALTLDPTKGVVIVQLHSNNGNSTDMSTVAGYGVTLGASHGSSFDPDAGGYATTTSVGNNSGGVLVFPNVVTGTTTVTVTAPTGHACTAQQAITSWRVDANVFSFVDYDCN